MPKPARSSAYLKWIRSRPCCVCGKPGPSEAAHGPNAGMSAKGSDLDALPLCEADHRTGRFAMHRLGWEEFAKLWGLELGEIRANLRERFERATIKT